MPHFHATAHGEQGIDAAGHQCAKVSVLLTISSDEQEIPLNGDGTYSSVDALEAIKNDLTAEVARKVTEETLAGLWGVELHLKAFFATDNKHEIASALLCVESLIKKVRNSVSVGPTTWSTPPPGYCVKECGWCHNEFLSKHHKTKFCSDGCKKEARKLEQKDYRKRVKNGYSS